MIFCFPRGNVYVLCWDVANAKGHLYGKSLGFQTEVFGSLLFAECLETLQTKCFPSVISLPPFCRHYSGVTALIHPWHIDYFKKHRFPSLMLPEIWKSDGNIENTENQVLGLLGNMFTIYNLFKFSRTQFLQKGKIPVILLEIFYVCRYLPKSPADLPTADPGSSGRRIKSVPKVPKTTRSLIIFCLL